MKIMHVLSSNRYSGAENVVTFIIKHLKNDYDFIYCSEKGQIEKILNEEEIPYNLVDKASFRNIKYLIKKENPDIIHAHDVKATLICALLKEKRKLISTIHVNNSNMAKFNLKTLLLLVCSTRVDHFFWVSNSCFENYKFKKFIINKSEILNNILSYDEVNYKASLDSEKYDYDVVYIGRLDYQKDPERLMEILKSISVRNDCYKIAIVGVGEYSNYVLDYIDKYKLKNIVYLGYKNNPLKILKDSKVMIMTSRFEGTPMVALEALALGIPIVSTPVDGMKDLIINNYNGYITDDNSLIISHITEIIENRSMQNYLSANAVKVFMKKCNVEEYLKKIRKEYDNV